MKSSTWLPVTIALALTACSGSSKSSGPNARTKFESRCGISLPAAVADWEFASVKVGDTYGEYFRFRCTREVFQDTATRLKLKPDPLPRYPGSTLWGSAAGGTGPNDPDWWKTASASLQVYHKEDYSTVANRSVMAFWYQEESSFAFMKVEFWD